MSHEEEIIKLATDNLPGGYNESDHIERIKRCIKDGALIVVTRGDRVAGYGEVYEKEEIPEFPVEPGSSPGDYLYCWSCVVHKDYRNSGILSEMKQMARDSFNCKYLVYHRLVHDEPVLKIEVLK